MEDEDADDIQEIQPSSSITFTQQRLSCLNNPPPPSTDLLNSQPNLLSIRQNLQKGKHSILLQVTKTLSSLFSSS